MKRTLHEGVLFIPPIILAIQSHTPHDWIGTLLIFALSFAAAQILFHPDDPLTKKIMEWF